MINSFSIALILFLNSFPTKSWKENINPAGKTVEERITLPSGFVRVPKEQNSFSQYLSHLPLKPHNSKVHYFDGTVKTRENVYCAVLNIPVGTKDLQQCADAVMRLRGEYLFEKKRYDDLHFNFLSDGKPRYFKTFAKGKTDYKTFEKYMEYIFVSANTGSLLKEMKPLPSVHSMQPGDVFIQKGNPYGHAEIVLDMAVNKTSAKKIYLLAQSYMPAQDIQILLNPINPELSPWFELNEEDIQTPEWTFRASDLRRFKD